MFGNEQFKSYKDGFSAKLLFVPPMKQCPGPFFCGRKHSLPTFFPLNLRQLQFERPSKGLQKLPVYLHRGGLKTKISTV